MAEGDLLEHVGKTLILFASIALVSLLAFVFLAVFSLIESTYSIPLPNLVEGLLPAALMAIVALVAGTVALVASKLVESTHMNPPPRDAPQGVPEKSHANPSDESLK
jgi:hypothetical protein